MADKGANRKIREATHAGIFYPEEGDILSGRVDGLVSRAAIPADWPAISIVSPHASMEYTGDLAALAWKSALGRPVERIVVMAPYHRAVEPAIFLPESEAFSIPNAGFDVDLRAVAELMDCGTLFVKNDIPHFEEHSIEVQLPYAARLFPCATIVPILVGRCSLALVRSLASGLRLAFSKRRGETLFVVSTDLEFAPSRAESAALSDRFLALVEEGDWEGIVEARTSGRSSICGAAAIAALLASGLAGTPVVLGRHDAGNRRESTEDSWGDYAAIAFR